jgi:hypothetical protein
MLTQGDSDPLQTTGGSRSCWSLAVSNAASRHYDKIHRIRRSRCCTKGETYEGVLCSKNLVVVLHHL